MHLGSCAEPASNRTIHGSVQAGFLACLSCKEKSVLNRLSKERWGGEASDSEIAVRPPRIRVRSPVVGIQGLHEIQNGGEMQTKDPGEALCRNHAQVPGGEAGKCSCL